MSDTIDALAEALYQIHSWPVETARSEARAIADALAGLSIVKTADWERVQRVEAAARAVVASEHGAATGTWNSTDPKPEDVTWYVNGTTIVALREALETP